MKTVMLSMYLGLVAVASAPAQQRGLPKDKTDELPAILKKLKDSRIGARKDAVICMGNLVSGANAETRSILLDSWVVSRSLAAFEQAAITEKTILGLRNKDEWKRISIFNSIREMEGRASVLVPALCKVAAVSDATLRLNAVYALEVIHDRASVATLIERLRDDKCYEVRVLAARALGQVGERAKDAIPELAAAIRKSEQLKKALHRIEFPYHMRYGGVFGAVSALSLEAGEAIAKMGKVGVPAAIELLKDANLNVRRKGVYILRRNGPDAQPAVAALEAALKDKDWNVRNDAMEALGSIGPKARAALASLLRILRSDVRDDQWGASVAIRKIDPSNKESLSFLLQKLKGKDLDDRELAVGFLSFIGEQDKALIKELEYTLLAEDSAGVRSAVYQTLFKWMSASGEPIISNILKGLRNQDAAIRIRAAVVLGEIYADYARPDSTSVPELVRALRDKNNRVRLHSALALGVLGSEAVSSVSALKAALRDRDKGVREAAKKALEMIK